VEALSQPDAQATVIGEVAPAAEPVVTPEAHDAALAEVQAQPVVSADTERFKIAGNELIDTAPTGPGPETAVDGVVELRPEAELLNPKGDTLKYVRELPLEDQEKVFRNFKRLSEVIFQTSDLSRGESYDPRYDTVVHPELLNARVAVVLADHQSLASLDKDALLGYDRVKNPLHYSQMKVVEKLNKAAVKTFGAAFGGEKDKTIEQYVLYLSALVSREGKKIPGFRMVN
jgi:hypothetical protein